MNHERSALLTVTGAVWLAALVPVARVAGEGRVAEPNMLGVSALASAMLVLLSLLVALVLYYRDAKFLPLLSCIVSGGLFLIGVTTTAESPKLIEIYASQTGVLLEPGSLPEGAIAIQPLIWLWNIATLAQLVTLIGIGFQRFRRPINFDNIFAERGKSNSPASSNATGTGPEDLWRSQLLDSQPRNREKDGR